jgi:hypothetical protein
VFSEPVREPQINTQGLTLVGNRKNKLRFPHHRYWVF